MNILITRPADPERHLFFPEHLLERLRALGAVRLNESPQQLAGKALEKALEGIQICVTQWGGPQFTPELLTKAPALKLIAHAAGTVTHVVTPEVYRRGVRVSSANAAMSAFVAEGTLADILAGLRLIPQLSREMTSGGWNRRVGDSRTLFGACVGMVGLGAVGAALLPLLEPFGVRIVIFDPYMNEAILDSRPYAKKASLEEVLKSADVLTFHAALTQETRGMIGASQLNMIRDGALIVNTARGALCDTDALTETLRTGRLNAVLDVFPEEPLPDSSPLRRLDNVIALPHVAGAPCRESMFAMAVDEIETYCRTGMLNHEVSEARYLSMTKE